MPVNMFSASKQPFDALTLEKGQRKQQRMVDTHSARETYGKKEKRISQLVWFIKIKIRRDVLLKENDNGAFDLPLHPGVDNIEIKLWIDVSVISIQRTKIRSGGSARVRTNHMIQNTHFVHIKR